MFLFHQQPRGVQVVDHGLARGLYAEPLVGGGAVHQFAFVGNYAKHFQVVALSYFKVQRVVGGGDFNRAGAELLFHALVGHQRDEPVRQRQPQLFAGHAFISLVFRVYRDRGVAQHGLGAGGSHGDRAGAVLESVAYVPELRLLVLVLDFDIGERGAAARAPVYHALPPVNQAFLPEGAESFEHRGRAGHVHGEAHVLRAEIQRAAELPQLAEDGASAFAVPGPGAL